MSALLTSYTLRNAHAATKLYPANIEFDHQKPYGWYEASNLTNPNIGAVDITLNWAQVEPQQGVFNWTPADNEMSAWVGAGKEFTLIVRYINELKQKGCTANQFLPAWEAARVPSICDSGGEILPDYFDVQFQSDLQAYVAAIQQHMASSPYLSSLVFVRIGVGMAGEAKPCVNCNSADLAQLNAWGYTVDKWATWQKSMLAGYQSTWSASPTSSVPLICPLGDNDKESSGIQVSKDVGLYEASKGFGVGQEGLHNVSGYANGMAVQIAKQVRATYPTAYIQFQTVGYIPSTLGVTEVNGDISIVENAGAFSVEWYDTDSTNPAYQASFANWQKYVNCHYSGIC